MTVLRSAAGAALLVNAIPHGVSGVRGRPFPTPFGDPPGVGLSSPRVNIGWSTANAIAGAALLRRGIRSPGEVVGAAVGAAAMAALTWYHFRDVLAGGSGLRGIRNPRPAADGAGPPPRVLVKATEPIAKALAGHRWFPLWAVVHHRGRTSGIDYETPVAVVPTRDRSVVLIGLPWGAKTNWARNVVAAGGAELSWKGVRRPTASPRIIGPVEAAVLAKPLFRPIVQRMPAAIALQLPTP
ncbi:hypothetical protein GCM10025760_21960 [Microbacterium yannicii]|uniref:Nitroreductase family deazaflavin-dependent oxidoreductase n=2 Tax=Microbacterium yannicii TaxID=671622 RepID=A0ABP9M863_9MICO